MYIYHSLFRIYRLDLWDAKNLRIRLDVELQTGIIAFPNEGLSRENQILYCIREKENFENAKPFLAHRIKYF